MHIVHYNLILPKRNHANKKNLEYVQYITWIFQASEIWAQKKNTKKTGPFSGLKNLTPKKTGTFSGLKKTGPFSGLYVGSIYLLLTDRQGANHAETPPVIPVQVRALGISVVEKDLSVSPAVDVCHALKF